MRTFVTAAFAMGSRLFLAAAIAAPLGVHAEKADREKVIQVLADRLTANDAKKEAVYEGNVVVTQGTLRITSARIVVREDPEGYRTFVATGDPVTFRQKRDNLDEWIDGSAARAEFDDRNDMLKLFTGAKLRSSQGELSGDFISYDRGNELFQVTGAAPGTEAAAGSRVKATIVPAKRAAEGKAGPAPQSPSVTLKPDPGTETGRKP